MQDLILSPILGCSICRQELTPPTRILSTCGHVVHKKCFENTPTSSFCCPSCSNVIHYPHFENKPPTFIHCSSCNLAGPNKYFMPLPLPTPLCTCCGSLILGVHEDVSTDQIVSTINKLTRELIQKDPEIETDSDLLKKHFFIEIVLQGRKDILSLLLDHEIDSVDKEDLIFSVLKKALSSSIKNASPESLDQSFESNRQTTIVTLLKRGIEGTLNKYTVDQEIIENGSLAVEKLARTVMQRNWTSPTTLLTEIFFEAVVQKEDAVISALLKRKITPYTTMDGISAFDKACQFQHISILAKFIIALLKSKAETASLGPRHCTAQVFSLPLATEALIGEVITKEPSINITSLQKGLLLEAIQQRNAPLSKFLLSKGISPNTIVNGISIFDKACEMNMRSIIGTLFYLKAQRALKKNVLFQNQATRILNEVKTTLDEILATDRGTNRKSLKERLLFESVVKNKEELFSFLLQSDLFPEVTVPTDYLLQVACSHNRHSMVLQLLKKWVEQTLRNNPAQPIICENTCSCIEKIAREIINKNPNIDAINLRKRLLFSAIEQKDVFLVSTLLKGGVHPTPFVNGISPLQKAYELNQYEILVLLVRTWIERDLCGKEVQDQVKQAVSSAALITQKILSQIKTFDINSFLPMLMFGAVELGDELLVSALLRGGIPPNYVVNGQSTLSRACELNRQPIVKLLLENVLKKTLEDIPDQSKVSVALCTMELLVADIFKKTVKIDSTSLLERLLFEAVIEGNETLVAGLLKAGISPYTKVDGVSVMKKADELKRVPIISLLLRATFVLKL